MFYIVDPVFQKEYINQSVTPQLGTSGSICVKYYCAPQPVNITFWNVTLSTPQLINIASVTTGTSVTLIDVDGTNITRTGYQSCLNITNPTTSSIIKFVVTYNGGASKAETYIDISVVGKYLNWNYVNWETVFVYILGLYNCFQLMLKF